RQHHDAVRRRQEDDGRNRQGARITTLRLRRAEAGMRRFLDILLGVPASEARIRAEAEVFVRARDVHAVRTMLNEQIAHMTGKSGALLQAQGIFVVVAIYALDKGWPTWVALSSMLL